MGEAKFIDALRVPLIKMAFSAIEKWLIEKIKFEPLRDLLKRNLTLMVEIVDKLTDKDPNNSEQLKAVWEEYKANAGKSLLEETISGIEKLVNDKEEADFLIETLRLLVKEKKEVEARVVSTSTTIHRGNPAC